MYPFPDLKPIQPLDIETMGQLKLHRYSSIVNSREETLVKPSCWFPLALALLELPLAAPPLPAVESGAAGVLLIAAAPANVVSAEPVDEEDGGGGGGGGGGANGVWAAHEDSGPGR